MNRSKNSQISETFLVASVLAMAGGFMDTYSYLCRGGVFANAETGNVVLFAINLGGLHWMKAIHFLVPILAFATGVVISESIKTKRDNLNNLHWRQIAILIEIGILIAVAFIPQELNLLVNSIISLTCGVQVCTFAKFYGNAMSTTMCTGNLRSGTQRMHKYFITKDRKFLKEGILYYGCILFFIIGAIVGRGLITLFGERAIIFAAAELMIAFLAMFKSNE